MGSPELRSDSEPIEPTDKSSQEQGHVSSIQNSAGVTRREALRATLRAAVLGVIGVTGLANAKEPSPTSAQEPGTVIANRQTGSNPNIDTSRRESVDGSKELRERMNAYAKEYSNLSAREITDLANLCIAGEEKRFYALNILADKKGDKEVLEKEFAKDVYIECSRVRARCGSIQCDLTEKMGHVNKIADPIVKAAYLAFIVEQATRVGDKGMVSEASAALSSVKKNGIGLSTSSILRIKLDAITAAINPASNKNGKPITMSVDTRLDVARETLDHFIPEAIDARDLTIAERARAIMYSKFTSGINQREVPNVVELRKDISDASRKLYALRNVERAYRKERNSGTKKLETAKAQSTAARWLMETGDWNVGCLHLKKSNELSANSAFVAESNAADLDLVASADNASASDLIKASNAWIYAGKSNLSNNKLYLRRVAELAGRLKCMKGLKFEEDAAIGKIVQHLKRNGIAVGEVKTESKSEKYFAFSGKEYIDTGLSYSGHKPITMQASVIPQCKNGTVIANFQHSGLGLEIKDGYWQFVVHNGKDYGIARSNDPVVSGKKIILTGVFDGKQVLLYINGTLQKEVKTFQGTHNPSRHPITIGADPNGNGGMEKHFSGLISDVHVFDASLANRERQLLSVKDPTIKRALVLSYDPDHLNNGIIIDTSGHKQNGTAHGIIKTIAQRKTPTKSR